MQCMLLWNLILHPPPQLSHLGQHNNPPPGCPLPHHDTPICKRGWQPCNTWMQLTSPESRAPPLQPLICNSEQHHTHRDLVAAKYHPIWSLSAFILRMVVSNPMAERVPWKSKKLLVWDATCPDSFTSAYTSSASREAEVMVALYSREGEDGQVRPSQTYTFLHFNDLWDIWSHRSYCRSRISSWLKHLEIRGIPPISSKGCSSKGTWKQRCMVLTDILPRFPFTKSEAVLCIASDTFIDAAECMWCLKHYPKQLKFIINSAIEHLVKYLML